MADPQAEPEKRGQLPGRKLPRGIYLRLFAVWLTLVNYWWVLLLILGLAGFLRARNPLYSSAYMDESIYVLYGRMFLSRHFEAPLDQPLQHSFGWYLWPALAAISDRLWGLVGLRELAALLGVVTVLAVFGFARRLFGPAVGLASATVFALLGPVIFSCRIATRDAATICFFALGLWLFARAWQEDDTTWLATALAFFAAFLSKYLVAIYFPFLVLLTLRRGRRSILLFSLPLALLCAAYGVYYARDLAALLQYGRGYTALHASAAEAWKIYVTHRVDFWILLGLSALAWIPEKGSSHWTRGLLLFGAALLVVFQWLSRADYDYWKHVNYSLLFLVPLAMDGLVRAVRRWAGALASLVGALAVGILAAALGWAGDAWHLDRFLFWPNIEPATAYLEGRVMPQSRMLVDDSSFRYYFHPLLRQWQIVDPFYFRYGVEIGEPAYAAAVRDGWFDYVLLDGGMGQDAERMRAAITPQLSARYALKFRMPDPVLRRPIEVYERESPPLPTPASGGPQVQILSPGNGELVRTQGDATQLVGVASGAHSGWYVRIAVFTNRWYPQGGSIIPPPDGEFRQTIYLAGEGEQRCYHLVRAELFNKRGELVATDLKYGVARANPDGSAPSCRSQ